MCLGIPGRIVEITDAANCLAKVDVSGVRRIISVRLLEKDMPEPDDWVLVHVGFRDGQDRRNGGAADTGGRQEARRSLFRRDRRVRLVGDHLNGRHHAIR